MRALVFFTFLLFTSPAYTAEQQQYNPAPTTLENRITSYNVCYTKLLRSQLGFNADYVNEKVISEADVSNGMLRYGPMSYQVLFIAGAKSLQPETALALENRITSYNVCYTKLLRFGD